MTQKIKSDILLNMLEDLEEARSKLEIDKKFIDEIIQNAGIPILAYDKSGKFLFTNNIFKTITGYKQEDLEDRNHFIEKAFPHKLAKEKIELELKKFYQKKHVKDFVIPIRCKNGDSIIVVNNITGIKNKEGNVIGDVFFMRNLSEIFQLEKQLRYWSANGFTQLKEMKTHEQIIKEKHSRIEITRNKSTNKKYLRNSSKKNKNKKTVTKKITKKKTKSNVSKKKSVKKQAKKIKKKK